MLIAPQVQSTARMITPSAQLTFLKQVHIAREVPCAGHSRLSLSALINGEQILP